MRPLARKILLTQGVIILLVLGVSIFSWLQMLDSRQRAAGLRAEYDLGSNHEKLVAGLRELDRGRVFYFLEKRAGGEKLKEIQQAFYLNLVTVAMGIDELGRQSATREDLAGLVLELSQDLDGYREMVGRLEFSLLADDLLAYDYAADRAATLLEKMRKLTEEGLQNRDAAMGVVIDDLGRRAEVGAGLALAFFGLALTVGLIAAYSLTRTIHRPVRALRAATEALSRGEFDRRIDVPNRDELGDLARAFNEMAARLQELDELKSGFISMVSHDLKTPLTSMKEAVEMLSEGVGGDLTVRQRRLLTIASESLDRLGRYVQGILDVFRFEAGRIHLVLEPLALTEVVREQIDLAEVRCQKGASTCVPNWIGTCRPWRAIAFAWRRSSPTCWTMPSSSLPTVAESWCAPGSSPGRMTWVLSSRSPTPAPASHRGISGISLTSFSRRPAVRGPRLAEPGWGWPSCAAWSRRTMAR